MSIRNWMFSNAQPAADIHAAEATILRRSATCRRGAKAAAVGCYTNAERL